MDVFILAIEVQKELQVSVHSTLNHAAQRLRDWVIDSWDDEIMGQGVGTFESADDAVEYFFEILEDDYSYTIAKRTIDAPPESLCKGVLPAAVAPQANPESGGLVFVTGQELNVLDTALRYVAFDLALEQLPEFNPGTLVAAIRELRKKLIDE